MYFFGLIKNNCLTFSLYYKYKYGGKIIYKNKAITKEIFKSFEKYLRYIKYLKKNNGLVTLCGHFYIIKNGYEIYYDIYDNKIIRLKIN